MMKLQRPDRAGRKMSQYAVIDTNVLISGMLKKNSIPNIIVSKSLVGDIVPLINEEILTEYREVTARPKFQFPQESVKNLLDAIIRRGLWQDAENLAMTLPDEKDRVFYETVVAGRKKFETYLVTGNLKHFPTEEFVVTPHQMLEILEF